MKSRVMTSLALPAALATAGLLSSAEAAYAAIAPDTQTGTAAYGYSGQPMSGDITLTPATSHPCDPIGNVTITDYGHCCPPVNNMTITDYGHCCPPVNNMTITDYGHCCPPVNNMTITDYGHCCNVGNVTIPDYGWFCRVDDDDPGLERGFGHRHEHAAGTHAPQRAERAHS
ncbi:hypothetical protein GCM10017744_056690 [Streptomyces antimycoticus]|uniref:Secreted protein n=2 Tax=Streptomyces antimycoticus TaxID=68175 RepID=A0A4D4K3Y5_9ACTN|nr:hypothetical protein [Streptomyces antimycoticus]GDY43675.1 hypothetical protein SANT12839_045570 [Streptomyces antimycoticus]